MNDMKKIGIFYGSTTGTTASVAEKIAENLSVAAADVFDVSKTEPSAVAPYDVLVMGCSTWGDGDMQDDMHDFMDGVQSMDLKGKKAAVFGCGDDSMSDTFCNGVGELYRMMEKTGADIIGSYSTDGYSFSESAAVVDGKAVGLLLDNMNHEDQTDKRIAEWCDELKKEM